ncbi:MAG TPA: transglycosylase SLT domain-containing protein [Methylomirabilota bacterium]|jgi:soluble lytic murein transglycosylase|nr:transglycosylase SLT domain-containing protein [Methylomirabilota bacterium]
MLGRYRESVRSWVEPVGLVLYRRLGMRPNHLTLLGLGVSFLAAMAFVAGRTRYAGVLLILAGLCDFLDGSLARASGQVSAFGAFLDSVIDRYSDLVVLLGIVVLYAQMPHARGAVVAMAGLIGSMMVSYTKARAESIGVRCTVGMMERPERMICLIAGALLDLLEPALWVLAILSNLTAIQRIAFTWRATRDTAILRALLLALALLLPGLAIAGSETPTTTAEPPTPPAATEPAAPGTAEPLTPSVLDSATPPATEPAMPSATEPATQPAVQPPTPATIEPLTQPTAAPAPASPPAAPPAAQGFEKRWAAAVEAYQRGEVEPLIREFGADAARDSLIGDYVRYLLADALARVDDLAGARAAALSVADKYPTSRLVPRALLLAAALDLRAGQDGAAQGILSRLITAYPNSPETPAALYLLGQSAEALGKPALAVQTYRELRVQSPASGYADGASDRLGALQSQGVSVTPLTPAQRADRADRLLQAGVPDQALSEAERLLDEVKQGPIALRALRIMADSQQRLRRFDAAARTLGQLADRSPTERRPALRLEQARVLVRTGDKPRAVATLDAVVAAGGDADKAEALYLKARVLEDQSREAEAIAVYRQVAANYPTREAGAASLWRLGWLGYLKKDAQAAQQSWTRLAELGGAGTYRYPALYWAGRAREQVGGDAQKLYGRILAEAPRSYYGLLASARIGRTKDGGVTSSISLPAEPREAIGSDPGFARVETLKRINLAEDAAQELEYRVQSAGADPVRLYGLAGAWIEAERYHMALRIMRRHFQLAAATGDPALPRAFWEIYYPWGWRDDVLAASQGVKLDPYLVAAVVREESSYYPRAVSRAGARGLMQLMPTTAQLLAPAGDLDDPAFNIQLGTRFLAGLLREFNDPRLALAAYNAGPNRVKQWWASRRSDDIEVFVEQIPFDETRLYVKRIVISWDEYRRIYAGP